MNSWDTQAFRDAVKATGKKNIIMSGLWTEVCICWPTLNMIDEGYNIYVVEDACGGNFTSGARRSTFANGSSRSGSHDNHRHSS